MIKVIVNGNEPSATDSLKSLLSGDASSLSQAKVIAAKKARSADARNAEERAGFNSSPLDGACVIQVPAEPGGENRPGSSPQ